jgi:tetratricopeptide (TPR) repeat protein
VYADPRVVRFVSEHFVPVRVHVREQKDQFAQLGERYSAHWTPTTLVLDASGEERHRIEGFLPADDFLVQLGLALGHSAFQRGEFETAAAQFGHVVDRHPQSDVAAEAVYWRGVARYKATSEPPHLAETYQELVTRHPSSSWAKKASIWAPIQT